MKRRLRHQTAKSNQFPFKSSVKILQIVFVVIVAKYVGSHGAM